jgi:hypothetical protein
MPNEEGTSVESLAASFCRKGMHRQEIREVIDWLEEIKDTPEHMADQESISDVLKHPDAVGTLKRFLNRMKEMSGTFVRNEDDPRLLRSVFSILRANHQDDRALPEIMEKRLDESVKAKPRDDVLERLIQIAEERGPQDDVLRKAYAKARNEQDEEARIAEIDRQSDALITLSKLMGRLGIKLPSKGVNQIE